MCIIEMLVISAPVACKTLTDTCLLACRCCGCKHGGIGCVEKQGAPAAVQNAKVVTAAQ